MGLIGLLDQYTSLVEGPLLPFIIAEFGINEQEFALWQGIFGIITFAVFFIAWFSDAFGRKKGILLLILVLGISDFLILFAGNFFLFMFLYAIAIMGTLSNLWEIPITEEAPAERRGIHGSIAFLLALIPIYALFADDIANAIGWRWGYGIMFFLMLALLIPWYFMKEPQRWIDAHKERGSKAIKIKTALTSLNRTDIRYILMCSIIYGLWTISFKMGATFARTYPTLAPVYSSILTIGGLLTMVGAVICGISTDKLGRNATLIIGCIGSVLGFFIMAVPVTDVAKIGFWMVYLFMPILMGWIMIYFGEIFPTKIRSTAVGITTTAARLSYVIGPLISSLTFLVTDTNYTIFWIMAGIFMIIPLLSLLIKPYETKGKTLEDVQKER
jgi:putative MFS transporter